MFTKMKLRTRVILTIIPFGVTTFFVVLYLSAMLIEIDTRYSDLTAERENIIFSIHAAQKDLISIQEKYLLFISNNDIDRNIIAIEIHKASENFKKSINSARQSSLGSLDNYKEIDNAYKNIESAIFIQHDLKRNDMSNIVQMKRIEMLTSEFSHAEEAIASLMTSVNNDIEVLSHQITERSSDIIIKVWMIIAFGFVFSGVLSIVFAQRAIIAAINAIRLNIINITDENLYNDIPFFGQQNELGEIAKALHSLKDDIQKKQDDAYVDRSVGILVASLQWKVTLQDFTEALFSFLERETGLIHGALFTIDRASGEVCEIGVFDFGMDAVSQHVKLDHQVVRDVLEGGVVRVMDVPVDNMHVNSHVTAQLSHILFPIAGMKSIAALAEMIFPGLPTKRQYSLFTEVFRIIPAHMEILFANISAKDLLEKTQKHAIVLLESEKRLQYALAEAKRTKSQLEDMTFSLPIGVLQISFDLNGLLKVLFISPEVARIFKTTMSESRENPSVLLRDIPSEDQVRLFDLVKKKSRAVLADGIPRTVEHLLHVVINGKGRIIQIAMRIYRSKYDGAPLLLSGFCEDVTARKNAEKALIEIENRHAMLVRGMNDGYWEFIPDSSEAFFTPRYIEMLGYAPLDFPNSIESFIERVHPEDKGALREKFNDCLAGRCDRYEIEFRVRHARGDWIWVLSRGMNLRDEEGRVARLIGTHTDIQARKQAEEVQRTARERLEMILEASPVGIAISSDGVIRFANPAMTALANIREGTADCLSGDDVSAQQEIQTMDPVGAQRDIMLTTLPMRHEGKASILKWAIDVTQIKRGERELAAAKEAAVVATKAKSEFLARMSHEVRTPINAILGMAHLALRTKLNAQQKDYLEQIKSATNSLLLIINDILDFSKIEAGAIGIEQIKIDVEDILSEVAKLISIKAVEKDIRVAVYVDRHISRSLTGDPLRIFQVALNLANNAVKFTQHGFVIISAMLVYSNDNSVVVKFSVRDSGIGIDAKNQKHIFQPFRQSDESTTRVYGGTGLGLAISKRMIELMGGDIGVESTPNVGSTFWFTIPFKQFETTYADARLPLRSEMSGISCLIAETESAMRATLANVMSDARISCVSFSSCEEAYLYLVENTDYPPALAIIGGAVTLREGLEAATRMRSVAAELKTVFLSSGNPDATTPFETLPDTFVMLPSPMTAARLFGAFDILVDDGAHRKGEAEVDLWHDSAGPLEGLHVLLAEDNEINQRLTAELLESAGVVVTLAHNGYEACEIFQKQPGFDVILMDIQMPGMDGLEASRKIRALPTVMAQPPIIALTAHAFTGYREKCLAAGMNDYLAKPFQPEALFKIIQKWTRSGANSPGESTTLPESLPPDLPEFPGISTAIGIRRTGGTVDLFLNLVKMFAVEYAATGSVLEELLRNGPPDAAADFLHTIKGAASVIGALDLAARASELETPLRASEKIPESGLREFQACLDQTLLAATALGEHLKNEDSI